MVADIFEKYNLIYMKLGTPTAGPCIGDLCGSLLVMIVYAS